MVKLNKTADLKCPICGSGRVRRSRPRAFLEHIALRFHRRRVFRCMDCYQRFYGHPESTEARQFTPPVIAKGSKPMPPRDQPSLQKTPVNSRQVEKRSFSRLPCRIPARVVSGSGPSIAGVLSDISLNGCFMETPHTVPAGDEIELSLDVGEETRSRALVRRSLPARGMGIEFTSMTVPNFRRLQSIARNSVRLHASP
jgi:PilZ domain